MYSSTAGTGSSSASAGSRILADRRQPSDSGIQACSSRTSRTSVSRIAISPPLGWSRRGRSGPHLAPKVARDEVVGLDLLELGRFEPGALLRVGTAGMETTAGRRRPRARDLARQEEAALDP